MEHASGEWTFLYDLLHMKVLFNYDIITYRMTLTLDVKKSFGTEVEHNIAPSKN